MTLGHTRQRVLNAGSGASRSGRIHQGFRLERWEEVRIDIDPLTQPDFVASVADLRGEIGDESFDAVWTSHTIEHLAEHEVKSAFCEFRRVLKADGFALVTCPNLEPIMKFALQNGLDAIAYQSPAGPIRALDMLYGHGPSITAGHSAMAHNTGFTAQRLGTVAIEAGFAEVRVMEGNNFDLWALLLMPKTDLQELRRSFDGQTIAPLFADRLDADQLSIGLNALE
jgi:SAM-dependent methyltransferase